MATRIRYLVSAFHSSATRCCLAQIQHRDRCNAGEVPARKLTSCSRARRRAASLRTLSAWRTRSARRLQPSAKTNTAAAVPFWPAGGGFTARSRSQRAGHVGIVTVESRRVLSSRRHRPRPGPYRGQRASRSRPGQASAQARTLHTPLSLTHTCMQTLGGSPGLWRPVWNDSAAISRWYKKKKRFAFWSLN